MSNETKLTRAQIDYLWAEFRRNRTAAGIAEDLKVSVDEVKEVIFGHFRKVSAGLYSDGYLDAP